MALTVSQSTSILYDLAMAIAGETRAKPMALALMQRLLEHTSCACGTCLVQTDRGEIVLVSFGNRALIALEGHPSLWGDRIESQRDCCTFDGRSANGPPYAHGLCLPLEDVGHILLFSADAQLIDESLQLSRALFAPVLRKFARSLKLCLDNERAEEALRQSITNSEAASRAKSAFLANVSHEIRTPLNAILGMTHLLQKEVETPSARNKLERITSAAQHLLQVLNDVLDLSKIEADRLSIADVELEPRALAQQVAAIMEPSISAKGLQLRYFVADDVPRVVRGDPFRTQQILLNYLANAKKFSSKGTVEMRISVERALPDSLVLKLSVSDEGVGLSQAQQRRLFQPFSQVDESNTRRAGGTGLGLAICRRLASLMGGDSGVASEQGVGSTFWATIRVHPADEHARRAPLRPRATHELQQGAKILIAEDDPSNQEVLRCLLEELGMKVAITNNGEEAVEAVRNEQFALALIDLQMPVLDGLDATRAIRKLPNGEALPIIAATANSFIEDQERCIEAGMNEHLSKPIDPAKLREILARWLPREVVAEPPAPVTAPAAPPPWIARITVFDAAAAITALGGRVELYERLVRAFVRDRAEDATRLRQLIAAREFGDARRAAHTLKSVCATIGAKSLAELAAELELSCAHAEPDASLDATVERFVSDFNAVHLSLSRALNAPTTQQPRAASAQLVDELLQKLRESDSSAVRIIEEHAASLELAIGPEFSAIRAHVERFEFDEALALLSRSTAP